MFFGTANREEGLRPVTEKYIAMFFANSSLHFNALDHEDSRIAETEFHFGLRIQDINIVVK